MKLYCILIGICFTHYANAQMAAFDTLFKQASQLRRAGHYTKAIDAYNQCLQMATAANDSLRIGHSFTGMGVTNDQGGHFEVALQYYFRALKIYEQIGNRLRTGTTLKNIGNTYRLLKNYEKALSLLQQALAVHHELRDSTSISNVLNDIGLVYMDQDSLGIAQQYFTTLNTTYKRYLKTDVHAYSLNNLAIIHSKMKQHPQAFEYYQAALAIMKKANDQYGIALILGNLGDLHYKMAEYTKALDYHLQSLAIIRQIQSNSLLTSAYDNLAKTYLALRQYEKAYQYKASLMTLKDTIYQEQSRKSYAEMEAKYQNEKKQLEIVTLQQDNKIANMEVSAQRRGKYLLLGASLFILIVAIVLYRSYTARKRINAALNTLNDQLQEANRSKAKLISIISHDLRSPVSSLFNFLQLQRINSGRMDQQQQENFSRQISQSSENLLEAMEDLLIWSKTQMDHFTPVMETIDAAAVIDEVIYLHRQFAATKQLALTNEAPANLSFRTDPNFIKIILRNLTSNAIKFTPAQGTVVLSAQQQDKQVILTVTDNGAGISEADHKTIFEWNSIRSDSSGLGLKLAREFTEKLGGTITVQSATGQGASFIVSLPVP
jgi:signal transduction histidine kinase